METLSLLLAIPLTVAMLLLPVLVIITPFRWMKQSKRLREIERRLQQLEGATAALAHGSPAKTSAAEAVRYHTATPQEPQREESGAHRAAARISPAEAKATFSVPEPEPGPEPETARESAKDAAPAAAAAVLPPVEVPASPARSEPAPAAPVVAAAAHAADAGPGRPQLAAAAVRDSARVSGGAPKSKAEAPAAATEPATEAESEPVLDFTGGPVGLRKPLRAALRGRDASDWEGRFGRLWLNVIGVVVLVVGIVLLIGYSLRYLGPSGKVATGLAVGAALLGAGWTLERLERYRAFARALLGGGWAVAYFTVYAAYNVDAAKVIDDPLWAMAALFVVACGMIGHSFRYRSQVVTGLAYGLAFFAIAISPVSTYSLGAVVLLGASMVAVLRAQPWYHLGLGGVIGSYLCFSLWYGETAGGGFSEESFLVGIGILGIYWLLFALSAFVRRPESAEDRAAVVLLSVTNGAGFLGFGYALAHLGTEHSKLHAFLPLAALAFAGLAYMLRRVGLRVDFLLHALAAVGLVAASVPLQLAVREISFDWVALPWALEAAAVLALGLSLHERTLRVASYLLALLVVAALYTTTLAGDPTGRQAALWGSVPFVVAFFFYAFELLQARAGKGDVLLQARGVGIAFGYGATALLAAFVWVEVARAYVALAWLGLGVAMFEIGVRAARAHVRFQGQLLAAGAAVALVMIDIYGIGLEAAPEGTPLWTLAAVAALALHWLTERIRSAQRTVPLWPLELDFASAGAYAGTALVAVLLWHELERSWVGAAWLALGVVVLEVGCLAARSHLRLQGLLLGAAALPPLLAINLYQTVDVVVPAGLERWLLVGGCALIYHWLSERTGEPSATGVGQWGTGLEPFLAHTASYAGTALLGILIWVEMDSVSVAVCWALLGLVLFELAHRLERPRLRVQSHVLVIASFARLFLANFTASGAVGGLSHRVVSVGPVITILFYLWYRLRERTRRGAPPLADRGAQSLYSYFAVIALALLARFELGRADTVLAWGPLAVLLLVLGLRLKDRDFRLQSYVLAALVFARSWATNLTLTGTLFGLSQRTLTTGVAVVSLAAAAGYCIRRREAFARLGAVTGWLGTLDGHARMVFSLLATVLLALLLAHEIDPRWLTVAWTVEAFAVLALGFVLVERCLRIYGLTLVLVCLLKLVVLDMQGVETLYRILSYIVLGAILLLMSLGYTRYQHLVRRYL